MGVISKFLIEYIFDPRYGSGRFAQCKEVGEIATGDTFAEARNNLIAKLKKHVGPIPEIVPEPEIVEL